MDRMDPMETGLRHRVKRAVRQMSEQHRNIRAIHGSIRGALERGGVQDARAALDRLQSAMEAHFALEDEVFFPALHGLRPEFADSLEALSREHAGFSEVLRKLGADLETSTVDSFQSGFDAYAETLAAHERREEEIVATLVESIVGGE
jgi:iron-sulfur cluster repair protein YtfE (RIC family)